MVAFVPGISEYTSPVYQCDHAPQPFPGRTWRSMGLNIILALAGQLLGVMTIITLFPSGDRSGAKGVMVYGPSVPGGALVPGEPSKTICASDGTRQRVRKKKRPPAKRQKRL